MDGFSRVLHNRWNRDLAPVAVVRPGEEIQLLCRDALDIGEAVRTMTPEASMTLDLGKIHPLTGQVEVEGAEPGDILAVEVLDISPPVDFGYVVDPTFTGADTGRQARVPIAPFMGILGVGPLRKSRYRTFPPSGSGGSGGNTDIRQLVKGTRIQLPVYAEGAKFSVGDGHMAQGDGEVTETAIETLMAVTLRFGHRDRPGPGGKRRERGPRHDRLSGRRPAAEPARGLYHLQVAGHLKINETVDLSNRLVSMTLPRGIFA